VARVVDMDVRHATVVRHRIVGVHGETALLAAGALLAVLATALPVTWLLMLVAGATGAAVPFLAVLPLGFASALVPFLVGAALCRQGELQDDLFGVCGPDATPGQTEEA